MQIPYEKQTLDNGLDVIVHSDRSCPIVAVNLWYHVGSKNEQPGRTGFAHLFEHLMFEGSEHHDKGFFQPLQEAGGSLNGSTSADRTNYWEVVPTGALDRALWMESDRMGFLLPALTEEKFETQRKVVLNERRQNYENRPYGMVAMALMPALFSDGHPYGWLTIGDPADLHAASFEDVREFFRTYYHPGNASLSLAGDIDVATGFDLARRYFGELPRGPEPPPVVVATERPSVPSRLVIEDRVELPRLYLSWRTSSLFDPGDAELDVLATILSGGKSSRLYRDMVHDRRIATDVSAGQGSREIAGTFSIVATAAPGHTLAELEAAITDQLDHVLAGGPTADEVIRTQTVIEADFAYRLQTVGGFGGRSDQLNAYNVYVDDPGYRRATLDNGVTVWTVAHRRAPVLTLRLLIPTGAAADPAGQWGLAALTADLLDEGTVERSDVELHEALTRLGAHLGIDASSDATVLSLTTLPKHARDALDLLVEVVTRPRFDASDCRRVRDLRINRVLQMRQVPSAVADRVFIESLYATHPYGHLAVGTEDSLRPLEADDVRGFHQRWYRPDSWTLVAVGDLPDDELRDISEAALAHVPASTHGGGATNALPDPAIGDPDARLVVVPRPDAVQSEIRLGHFGVARDSPDYHSLLVLNMVLGGQFVSRINLNLREDKGYTYGARTVFDWRVGRGPLSVSET